MAPGAFRGVLTACDCRYLFNHDGLPLAGTTAGTLDVNEDSAGLFYEARLDTAMSTAGDLVLAIEPGDVTQDSFGFVVAEDRWTRDYTRRTILKIDELLRCRQEAATYARPLPRREPEPATATRGDNPEYEGFRTAVLTILDEWAGSRGLIA
jgi:HK97 family phage prohead protease